MDIRMSAAFPARRYEFENIIINELTYSAVLNGRPPGGRFFISVCYIDYKKERTRCSDMREATKKRSEITRVFLILTCIMIGLAGIYAALRSNMPAVRVASVCITMLGLIFSWDI